MRNLRHRYNPAQRNEFQEVISSLYKYIMPLLLKRQEGACALCRRVATYYEIDHKTYNPMMTLDHLRALCWPCHKSVTNFTPYRNR